MDPTEQVTFPPIPLDVVRHILSFCHVPTLAVTSRASLAFLELSSPFLYRDITIEGEERLNMLARSEVGTLNFLSN